MAALKQKDLEHLSSDEIKNVLTSNDYKTFPPPIKEYIGVSIENPEAIEFGNFYTRYNRVTKLLEDIIVNRFITGTL